MGNVYITTTEKTATNNYGNSKNGNNFVDDTIRMLRYGMFADTVYSLSNLGNTDWCRLSPNIYDVCNIVGRISEFIA
jgi:hypothetical protein